MSQDKKSELSLEFSEVLLKMIFQTEKMERIEKNEYVLFFGDNKVRIKREVSYRCSNKPNVDLSVYFNGMIFHTIASNYDAYEIMEALHEKLFDIQEYDLTMLKIKAREFFDSFIEKRRV